LQRIYSFEREMTAKNGLVLISRRHSTRLPVAIAESDNEAAVHEPGTAGVAIYADAKKTNEAAGLVKPAMLL
jgi:hypothetical protein